MNNRNFWIFLVASLGILLGHMYLTRKLGLQPETPKQAPPAQTEAKQAVATPSASSVPIPAPVVAEAKPKGSTLLNKDFEQVQLRFRMEDATVQAVTWNPDGTQFFPASFPGFGSVRGLEFSSVETSTDGKTISFSNPQGDLLSYTLTGPNILEVKFKNTVPAALGLIPHPTPQPEHKELESVLPTGRVFSIQNSKLESHTWTDILKGGWFSKPKPFPSPTRKVGLDAGVESSGTSSFFAVIWETPQDVTLDAQGYHFPSSGSGEKTLRLYLGPKEKSHLERFGSGYEQVQDFGFFGAIAKGLYFLLKAIQKYVGNWGWAIVLFSVIVRLAMWPLNHKTTVSSMRMKDLEPYQKSIQAKYEKFGNDMTKKAEMQQELMAFYKKNGYNPMGGCLPAILQMPVFMALWSMLNATFELRKAPWLGWIQDLSGKDPYYILPVFMGATMFASQLMTPAVGDPQQRKIMLVMMPVMMTFFFAYTPSGLVLYYAIFNLVSMIQTLYVMKTYKTQSVVL